jgi:hypothetical protein
MLMFRNSVRAVDLFNSPGEFHGSRPADRDLEGRSSVANTAASEPCYFVSLRLWPSFQNVPQGTEKCFAQSNMAFEELHVIVHRCLRHHRGGEPCAQLRSWELLPWF